MLRTALFYLLLFTQIFSAPLFAVDLNQQQTDVAREIFANTMSPYCPGRLLQDCPSSAASELKDKIRTRIAQGESRQSIEEYLVGVYGDTVKASPDIVGFGLAAWIAPGIFLLAGLALVFLWLRKNFQLSKPAQPAKIDPSWNKKIDKEISDQN